MLTNPESTPVISRHNQQRIIATHEENRPETDPIGKILTALVAEDRHNQAEHLYQDSNWIWTDTREQLIGADPATRAAKKRCQQISAQIEKLEDSQVTNQKSRIKDLRAELEKAERPYTKAASRASINPEVKRLAGNREQNRLNLKQAKQDLQQTRAQALAEINQNLPINLTWGELEDILGNKIKQELEVAELRLLTATIDRQAAITAANQALKSRLAKIRSVQTAAIRIRNLSDD